MGKGVVVAGEATTGVVVEEVVMAGVVAVEGKEDVREGGIQEGCGVVMFGIVKIKMMEMPRKLLQKCPWCKRVLMTSGNKLWVKLVMSGNKWMVVIMRFYMEKEGTKSQESPDAPLKPPNPA